MDALAAYVAVWSEPDPRRRAELLDVCWTEQSEVVGPGYRLRGVQAVLDEVARFQRDDPGCMAVQTSGFDRHGRWARFTIAVLDARGAVVNEGWDVVELDAAGRIVRVVTFWGPLPAARA